MISDSQAKNKFLRKNLTTPNTYLDEKITDTFLHEELEKISPCSARNIKLISQNILMMHKGNKEKRPLLITKESVTSAINEYIRTKAEMEYDIEDETDEQRQERHHRESMHLQEKHFFEQQQMQFYLAEYQYLLSKQPTLGIDYISDRLTPCQKNILATLLNLEKNARTTNQNN